MGVKRKKDIKTINSNIKKGGGIIKKHINMELPPPYLFGMRV